MHPGVAATVPSTPEAAALLAGKRLRPLTFGGLLTKLVERGAVQAGSRRELQAGTCALLGINQEQFSALLQEPGLIPSGLADHWSLEAQGRKRDEIIQKKQTEVHEYLTERILGQLPDRHLDKLSEMVAEQRHKVSDLVRQADDGTRGMLAKMVIQARLDSSEQPRLQALEVSRFAVSLPQLLGMLRNDPLLIEHGEGFQKEFMQGLGYELPKDRGLYAPNLVTGWLEGDTSHWSDQDKADFENTWLAEADISVLAPVYTDYFYGINGPGEHVLADLQDPVTATLYISEEEERAFFESYPLAHDKGR